MMDHEEGEVDDFSDFEDDDKLNEEDCHPSSLVVNNNNHKKTSSKSSSKSKRKTSETHSADSKRRRKRKNHQNDDSEAVVCRPPGHGKGKPPFKKAKDGPPSSNGFSSKKLKCKYYMEGRCTRDDCPFSHDFIPEKKPDVCRYYLSGNCAKGEKCVFHHAEFPCKYFHTGKICKMGDHCRFSHAPLTSEFREMLDRHLQQEIMYKEESMAAPPAYDMDYRPMPPMSGFGRPVGPPLPPPHCMQPPMMMGGGPFPAYRGCPPPHAFQRPPPPAPTGDVDYRGLPRGQLPPPFLAANAPPFMTPPPTAVGAGAHFPPSMRPDDQLTRMAAMVAAGGSKQQAPPPSSSSSDQHQDRRISDPRLSQNRAPVICLNRPSGPIYGGLPKTTVSWKLAELDLGERVKYCDMDMQRSERPAEENGLTDPRLKTNFSIFSKAVVAATTGKEVESVEVREPSPEVEKMVEESAAMVTEMDTLPSTTEVKKEEVSRRPTKLKLNEMANTTTTTKTAETAVDRSYLADPRFKRKKVVFPVVSS